MKEDATTTAVLDRVASAWRCGCLGETYYSPSGEERDALVRLCNEKVLLIRHRGDGSVSARPGEHFDVRRPRSLRIDTDDDPSNNPVTDES